MDLRKCLNPGLDISDPISVVVIVTDGESDVRESRHQTSKAPTAMLGETGLGSPSLIGWQSEIIANVKIRRRTFIGKIGPVRSNREAWAVKLVA
ncbi:MAG: hypothetical protein LQ342_005260 [Letrouitia transgressa]|nr:MAG: hypothetical protein LQ342_005260 [Letrouitia transgressa]